MMLKIGSALALSCAIALSLHDAKAQGSSTGDMCRQILQAAVGSYMDSVLYGHVSLRHDRPREPYKFGARMALGTLIRRIGCNEDLWTRLAMCIEDATRSTEVKAGDDYNVIANGCYYTVVGP